MAQRIRELAERALRMHLTAAALLERFEELERAGYERVPLVGLPYLDDLLRREEGLVEEVRRELGLRTRATDGLRPNG